MSAKQINGKFARKVALVAQRGGVSTQDVAEVFVPRDLYNKLYCGWGSGGKAGPVYLSAEERSALSFALTAMSNTFLDLAPHLPKQVARKAERQED